MDFAKIKQRVKNTNQQKKEYRYRKIKDRCKDYNPG